MLVIIHLYLGIGKLGATKEPEIDMTCEGIGQK